jgi:hypothetical protein
MPVQQVLRAIQHLLEETPELSDSGISFDAEAVESLIEEVARRAELASEDIEITPGLVIVHRGENDVSPRDRLAAGADSADPGGETRAKPFSAREEASAEGADTDAAKPAYVNIFAARGAGAANKAASKGEGAAADDNAAGGDDADPATQDRLRDIFAETIGDPDGKLFSERFGKNDDDGGSPNLFARAGARGRDSDATDDTIFGAFELRGGSESSAGDDNADFAAIPADLGDPGDADSEPAPDNVGTEYTVAGLVQAASATTVPDMMICAAAWMVLLQGKVSFTRREVLDVFDKIPGDHEKTLEAQIKGFGKATRNGQLIAVEDGLFGLSQEELDRFERLL